MFKTRFAASLFTAPLVAALLAGGTISLAQAAPGAHEGHAPQGPNPRVEALFDSWQLDDDTRQAFADEQRDYREQIHSLREEHRQRLGKFLDEQQLDALHAMMSPHRPMMMHSAIRGGPGNHHQHERMAQDKPGELFSALFKSWGLSDAEQAKLDDARQQFFSQARELRNQQFDSREAKRDAWQALRDAHRQALDEVLSDDQLAVLEQLRPSRHYAHGPDADDA
ncbi:hypothetical protein R6258_10860 [Halomonas sp. HP20-15]|uniref:hypothetical protein n=1 Tax=Halomonas sp. HP20-15 TaxID=3085901 RepID=UPI002980D3C4|nr:hypothetical protein [Halomonas sp. HP20-15]MDW5377416.1 hypothetical protein [Halomonas sp. HP20-15]